MKIYDPNQVTFFKIWIPYDQPIWDIIMSFSGLTPVASYQEILPSPLKVIASSQYWFLNQIIIIIKGVPQNSILFMGNLLEVIWWEKYILKAT